MKCNFKKRKEKKGSLKHIRNTRASSMNYDMLIITPK